VPDDTPHLPVPHSFFSHIWSTEDDVGENPLGEVRDGSSRFHKGNTPLTPPCVTVAGTVDDIRNATVFGEIENDDPENKDKFYPPKCYEKLSAFACPENVQCPDIANLAYIQSMIFTSPHLALARFNAAFGPADREKWVNGADDPLRSTSYAFRLGTKAYLFIDGTRSFGQFMTQAYHFQLAPQSYGDYGTNTMFEDNAREVLNRLSESDWALIDEWHLTGHSYGGATACVVAAKLRLAHPNHKISLLTFGAPAIGDNRLKDILRRTCQRHVYHPLDPVAFTPPRYPWVDVPFVSPNTQWLINWDSWVRASPRYQLNETGMSDETENPTFGGETILSNVALNIINNIDLGAYTYHDIGLYSDNAALLCALTPPPT